MRVMIEKPGQLKISSVRGLVCGIAMWDQDRLANIRNQSSFFLKTTAIPAPIRAMMAAELITAEPQPFFWGADKSSLSSPMMLPSSSVSGSMMLPSSSVSGSTGSMGSPFSSVSGSTGSMGVAAKAPVVVGCTGGVRSLSGEIVHGVQSDIGGRDRSRSAGICRRTDIYNVCIRNGVRLGSNGTAVGGDGRRTGVAFHGVDRTVGVGSHNTDVVGDVRVTGGLEVNDITGLGGCSRPQQRLRGCMPGLC